nr:unnamed protein product [Digitaria exilis]
MVWRRRQTAPIYDSYHAEEIDVPLLVLVLVPHEISLLIPPHEMAGAKNVAVSYAGPARKIMRDD